MTESWVFQKEKNNKDLWIPKKIQYFFPIFLLIYLE